MWIFTPLAFFSIVAHRTKPGVLLVRARLKGDLQRVFPGCVVSTTPHADYRFRTELPRATVAARMADLAGHIDYPNVKNAIPHGPAVDDLRYRAMNECWGVMNRAQSENAGGGAKNRPPVRAVSAEELELESDLREIEGERDHLREVLATLAAAATALRDNGRAGPKARLILDDALIQARQAVPA